MRTRWAAGIGLAALVGMGPTAFAADHTDGTTTGTGPLADASADITDLFAWMSSDTVSATGKVYLVMDVFPGASSSSLFSTSVKYVFHTSSQSTYGGASVKRDIICTFSGTTAPQTTSCWITEPSNTNMVDDYVTGDASTALTSTDSKVKVFAGVRNDPFFFNLAGFRNATSAVAAAIANYTAAPSTNHTYIAGFDSNSPGCPILSNAARTTVAGYLGHDCTGSGSAKDFFRKPETTPGDCTSSGKPALVTTGTANEPLTGNVLALVLSVDKTLLNSGGSILSVWGATNK